MLAPKFLSLTLACSAATCRLASATTDVAADTEVGSDGSHTDVSELNGTSPANERSGVRGDNTNKDAEAAPVFKVGGKAEHPFLGEVTILVLGALGAKIEFFSVELSWESVFPCGTEKN